MSLSSRSSGIDERTPALIKRALIGLILILVSLGLAACGGEAPAADLDIPNPLAGTPTLDADAALSALRDAREAARNAVGAEDDFTVEVMDASGGVTRLIAGSGSFRCEDARQIDAGSTSLALGGTQTISVMGMELDVVTLGMPIDTPAGTYPLQSPELPDAIYVQAAIGSVTYDQVQSGTATLETVPAGPDQPARGTFEAVLGSAAGGEPITLHGQFDFTSIGQAAASGGIDLSAWYCE
jgi:hypothetical protein